MTFRTVTRGLVVPFVLLALLGTVFVAGALVVAANNQDAVANAAATRLVRNEIDRLGQGVKRTAFDHSYWDQAVENLVERFDPAWADDNIGVHLHDHYGIDFSYVLDPDNHPTYGFPQAHVDPFVRFSGGAGGLVGRARRTAADAPPVPVSGVLRDGGHLVLAVASALTTYRTVDGRSRDHGTSWVLLVGIELTPARVAEIGKNIGIAGLAVTSATEAPPAPHVALRQDDGRTIGLLTWPAVHPGRRMLVWALPGLGFILLFLTGLGIVFMSRAARMARELERQTAAAIQRTTRTEDYLALVGIMMVALDGNGRVTLVNRKACEILGCRETDMTGIDWIGTVVADRHRNRQREVQEAALAGRIETVREHETLITTRSGETRLIAWHNSVIEDSDGGIAGLLSWGQDITGKREAEETRRRTTSHFQAILNHSPSSIFLKDLNGRFIFVNQEFARRVGIPVEDAIGKTDDDFLDPETAKRLAADEQEIMETGKVRQTEIALPTVAGQRTIMSLKFPILDEAGNVAGIGGIGTDITERERAKAAALKLQGELAQVLRLGTVGEIASGLAQEVNQPLTAIMNYAVGMLRRLRSGAVQPEDTLRVFEIVAEQAKRAGDIVRRMRQFARRDGPAFIETDINQAIREAIGLVTPDAAVLKVAIGFDLDESLPPALANAVQIQQVVLNLARNALDAMATRGSALASRRLTLATRHTESGMIEVSVADSGPGVPDKIRSRVLDPFFSTHEGSIGMGLPICKTIVAAHGGTLWFTSGPERGTTFCFSVPVAPHALMAEPETNGTAPAADPPPQHH